MAKKATKKPDPKHDRWETTMKQHRALAKKVGHLRIALGAFIGWTGQTAGSPLSRDETQMLLRMLDGKK